MAVGERAGGPHVVTFRERHTLVEPQQVRIVGGRVVLDEHHHVVHLRREIGRDEVQPLADRCLEVLSRHLHHAPIIPDRSQFETVWWMVQRDRRPTVDLPGPSPHRLAA